MIDIIEEDDLRTNAAVVGDYFREKLEELQSKHAIIGDVRGMGLMQALELVEDRTTKKPLHQHERRDGRSPKARAAGGQGRLLRQRDPHVAAVEYFESGCR